MSGYSISRMTPKTKNQDLSNAYAPPVNFLEVEVVNPITHTNNNTTYTDYEVRLKTNLPIFECTESVVRRRYSDFEWLRQQIAKNVKIVLPFFPSKHIMQTVFGTGGGKFDPDFIEERRVGLESFLSKVVGHPLANQLSAVHMFLKDPVLDRSS